MRIPFRLLAAALLLNAALHAGSLALPGGAAACTCMAPSLREVAAEPRYMIVAGTIHDVVPGDLNVPTRGMLRIDRVFEGDLAVPELPIRTGTFGMCELAPISNGVQLVAAVTLDGGALVQRPCGPAGDAREEHGRALLAEAEELFGRGPAPGEAPPEPSRIDLPTIAIVAVGGTLLTVILLVVLSAVRAGRGQPGPEGGSNR